MKKKKPSDIVKTFIERINAHDVVGLSSMMTPDHVFLDGMGTEHRGRETMREAWISYFSMFPDYRITVERMFELENVVAVFGTAGGTYARDGVLAAQNQWQVPAAWMAEVKGDAVSLWRVYADNEPVRRILAGEAE